MHCAEKPVICWNWDSVMAMEVEKKGARRKHSDRIFDGCVRISVEVERIDPK